MLQPWIEVMLANCRDVWERDYAHLAPQKKMKKKRNAFAAPYATKSSTICRQS
jgi:hypothetical protein